MGLSQKYEEGRTPLDDDEVDALLIPTIATRHELDEFEQQNIEKAVLWSLRPAADPKLMFTGEFICKVHERMFGDVWRWAGQFRKTNKNIGVDKEQVPMDLRKLLDDARYWYENGTFSPDELVVRFKHRLVSIHCFANGNGRHSRLMADIFIGKIYKLPVFSWGANTYSKSEELRTAYLKALRMADKGEFSSLLDFSRS